jgi:hypothetical protein
MRGYPWLASSLESEMYLNDMADDCISPHKLVEFTALPQTSQATASG